ncbi:hypothetical protein BKA80DRAFT_282044 [Phyllosticta citrichinensis]
MDVSEGLFKEETRQGTGGRMMWDEAELVEWFRSSGRKEPWSWMTVTARFRDDRRASDWTAMRLSS